MIFVCVGKLTLATKVFTLFNNANCQSEKKIDLSQTTVQQSLEDHLPRSFWYGGINCTHYMHPGFLSSMWRWFIYLHRSLNSVLPKEYNHVIKTLAQCLGNVAIMRSQHCHNVVLLALEKNHGLNLMKTCYTNLMEQPYDDIRFVYHNNYSPDGISNLIISLHITLYEATFFQRWGY